MGNIAFTTDDFTDIDGTFLDGHNPYWNTTLQGGLVIYNNGAEPDLAGDEQGNIYMLSVFDKWKEWGPNQYSKIELVDIRSYTPGCLVRGDNLGNDYGADTIDSNTVEIFKHEESMWFQLATASYSTNSGDHMRLEVTGSDLSLYINNNLVLTVTDTTYTDGAVGVYGYSGGLASPSLDNWEGGRTVCNTFLTKTNKLVRFNRNRNSPMGRHINLFRRR